jgi:ArsR family transcriptional regulator, lead/cadmium/zinc/bismuth-responsive transcriptional repressor
VVDDIAEVFSLLGDPGRLRLLVALREGEQPVGELAAAVGASESNTSHSLRLLRAHRVVESRRDGRHVFYRLSDAHVRTLLDVALAHLEHAR